MFSFQIFCAKNFIAKLKLQTSDGKSKISLIILKGNLPYVLKKCMFKFIKYLIVRKAK